ncbi:unnamed protein product [Paramecium primaurelia]|uniref:GLPGLI family protein n=1 Tax=Paramecium primaurelia TaxID=5886 RepID=A0A8S1NFR0_PARPR|nr:unnamed protein product [Paramecium primaurelia]
MKSIFISILLITVIAKAQTIFQEQSFNQYKYFRIENIAFNFQYTHFTNVNKEVNSRNYQRVNSNQPGNQELITLFYKLLTIQV